MPHATCGRYCLAIELPRGAAARVLAERVLVSLVHGLGARASLVTLLGGLVPAILASNREPPAPAHLGTTDVDVLLSVHLAETRPGYESLEETLRRIGFEPDGKSGGWRWIATVEGARVKIEFLCDRDDAPAEAVIRPMGATSLAALNLRGTRYVAEDWVEVQIEGRLIDRDGTVRVSVRVAGLEGYLLAKAHAILARAHQKDYYDFAYVLLYNSRGGPREAADALKHGRFADVIGRKTRLWGEIADRFGRSDRVGAVAYSAESLRADPSQDVARLREDAVTAVAEFFRVLLEP